MDRGVTEGSSAPASVNSYDAAETFAEQQGQQGRSPPTHRAATIRWATSVAFTVGSLDAAVMPAPAARALVWPGPALSARSRHYCPTPQLPPWRRLSHAHPHPGRYGGLLCGCYVDSSALVVIGETEASLHGTNMQLEHGDQRQLLHAGRNCTWSMESDASLHMGRTCSWRSIA